MNQNVNQGRTIVRIAVTIGAAALCLIALLLIYGCSGGGGGESGSISPAPTVEGLGCSTCPAPVQCTAYKNPGHGSISVDPAWQERLDLCCPFRLCEVGGECRYGCPDALTDPRCR
jgi:hypothetical protein